MRLDQVVRLLLKGPVEERPEDGYECPRCFGAMHLPYGLDPSVLCNLCAQAVVVEPAEALERMKKRCRKKR